MHHAKYLLPLSIILFFIMIATCEDDHRVIAASDSGMQESDASKHFNFFRATLRRRPRGGIISCGNDPQVCLDRGKNPWGGTTCCFHKWCRDTLRDSRNCGACGNTCGFGFVCCDGNCVDIQNDPKHCGSCFQECLGQGSCSFAMCDYGG